MQDDDPVDALDPWDAAVTRRLGGAERLVWTYDLARGFCFGAAEDEKKFRDLCAEPKPPSQDPIQQARAQLEQMAALPKDPAGALNVMVAVFKRAAESTPPLPCIAILPDVDTLCPASVNAANSGLQVALAIVQFAANHQFRRAGHLLLMSAPASRSLDERLRRPDSPIKVVSVGKPDVAERAEYLAALCRPNATELKARAKSLTAQISKARSAETEARAVVLKNARRAALESMRIQTARLADDDESLRLGVEVVKAERELKKARENAGAAYAKECRDRENKLAKLVHKLDDDPGCKISPLSERVWGSIRRGDSVRITTSEGTTAEKVVLKCDMVLETSAPASTIAHLSLTSAADKPHCRQDGKPVDFCCIKHGLHDYQSRKPFLPGAKFEIVPTLRREVQAEIETVKAQQAADETADPNVKRAKQVVEQAEGKLNEHLARLKSEMQTATKETGDRIKLALAALDDPPTNPEIESLEAELAASALRLKRIGSPDYFEPPSIGIPELVCLSQGLGYRDLLSFMQRTKAVPGTQADVIRERQDILNRSYGHLLDVVEPTYGFEGIAGLDGIKTFLLGVRHSIQSGDLRNAPMGCMLMGPPGTGKTAVAEAFARECGFLFVQLRNLRSMWVGESERQQEEVMQALRDLAPVVVLRDEVDEEDSGRDSFQGDSGVSGRLRRQWMKFLSDPKIRGRIFVISCTNRPDRLDPALKRSGRTDERIPLLMPDAATRRALFRVMCARYGYAHRIANFVPFAEHTDGLSGADIETIVRHAYGFAAEANQDAIDEDALRTAIEDFVPAASSLEIAAMTLAAIKETSSRRFLPQDAQRIVQNALAILSSNREPEGETAQSPTRSRTPTNVS